MVDIAQAFRLVIEKPMQQHERFVLSAGSQTMNEVVAFAKSGDPELLHERPTNFHTDKVRQILGWQPKTKKQTFVDMREYLKEAEKAWTK